TGNSNPNEGAGAPALISSPEKRPPLPILHYSFELTDCPAARHRLRYPAANRGRHDAQDFHLFVPHDRVACSSRSSTFTDRKEGRCRKEIRRRRLEAVIQWQGSERMETRRPWRGHR